MFSAILLQIILGIIFLLVSLLIFTFPAAAILKFAKILPQDSVEKYTLSTILGVTLFTLIAYILAFVHLRFLMWSIPLTGILALFFLKKEIFPFTFNLKGKIKMLFVTVLLLGIAGQVAVNAPSGFKFEDGIYFWSSHGHDGIWHISLIEELQRNIFPFQNPEYANHRLQNYHFFVDLLMSEIARLFHFSSLDVYFRFIPVLFSLLLGLGSFMVVKAWTKKDGAGIWAMFFTYFAGSFGYLLTIPRSHNLYGESIFWVSQTQSVLGNPPHASAFIILLAFLYCLLKFYQTRQPSFFMLAAFLGGVVIEFKVYAGVLVLGGLLIIGLWNLIFNRKFITLLLFFLTGILAFVIYFPNSVNSQEFLIWHPWWYIRTMVVVPDRLDWLDMELRRQTYVADGNWKRVLQLETMAFLIFLFGNLGMRFLGFWSIAKQLKDGIHKNLYNIFFLSITIASFLIPVLFLQKGVVWNSIQFNQYFLLLFGLLAGISVADMLSKVKTHAVKIILVAVIIFLSVPTQFGLLQLFYTNLPLSKVTYEEIEALKFLNNHSSPDAVILTAPFNKYERDKFTPPVPIYSWYDTGYVPAFSQRRTLISDEEQVGIMGYGINGLLEERKKAFIDSSPEFMDNFLLKNSVDYIYLVWGQKIAAPLGQLNIKKIYSTENTQIYQVMKNRDAAQ